MNNEVNYVSPFKKFCITIGNLPTAYIESMSYYEGLTYLVNYLSNNVIPTVNNNSEVVEELQTFVSDYFNNLDVQEEINKKLDEMAEDGSLTNLIKGYIDPIQEEFENDINDQISDFEDRIENQVDTIETKVNASVGIQPIPVSSVDDMTNTNKVYVNTTDGYWYFYTGNVWTQGGVYQATSDTTKVNILNNEMEAINGNLNLNGLFEVGNITITNTGWVYSSSNTRVRTKEGTTISLKIGDQIKINNEDVEMYLGYLMPNSVYEAEGWTSDDFTVRCNGDYVFLFRITGEQENIESPEEITQYIQIQRNNKISQLNQINDMVTRGNYIKQTLIDGLDQGGYSPGGYQMFAYGKTQNKRIGHKDVILSSKPIVVEALENYEVSAQRYSSATKSSDNLIDDSSWRKQIIINPNEYTCFQIRLNDNSIITDLDFNSYLNIYYLDYQLVQNYSRSNIKSINHRGYNSVAPENTIPAFKLSKEMGFNIVETDVRLTSDNVPVLLHDSTIDRTSNGSGSIASMTYSQVSQYDFGSWKGDEYAGTTIPTLEELLELARNVNLYCYLELESGVSFTQSIIDNIISMIASYDMLDKVTFISFDDSLLQMVKKANRKVRLGYIPSNSENYWTSINKLQALKTEDNEIIYDGDYTAINSNKLNKLKAYNIPYEVWVPYQISQIVAIDNYVSGFTCDVLNAETVLYNYYMQ